MLALGLLKLAMGSVTLLRGVLPVCPALRPKKYSVLIAYVCECKLGYVLAAGSKASMAVVSKV